MSQALKFLLSISEVAVALGVSERKAHQLRHDPTFPLPIALGGSERCLRWRVAEIEAYATAHQPAKPQSEPIGLALARAARKARRPSTPLTSREMLAAGLNADCKAA